MANEKDKKNTPIFVGFPTLSDDQVLARKRYLTIEETADILRISARHVRRLETQGKLKGVRHGSALRIVSSSIVDYMKKTEAGII